MAMDLAGDVGAGADVGHLVVELMVFGLSVGGIAFLWRRAARARREAGFLERDLSVARAEADRWKAESQDILKGLGEAIARQFERWGLTPAEREVALLLLKGLSHKQVAEVRSTSERTVRQQSLAIYRKSGLAGRAELAAFFLEDLLLPQER